MSELQPDPSEFSELTRKISDERGFACASYKEKCLRRRVAVRMRARGVHTYGAYCRLLDDDAKEYEHLMDALTINVTKLFRNWDSFAAMARHVIPVLWAQETDSINVWSAGCSSGDEAYSIGILFHRYAAANDALSDLGRVRILGTDIDRESLGAAERGEFIESDFADTPEEIRSEYFERVAPFKVSGDIRGLVRFARRDLLTEPAPAPTPELIVCRNVLIYFDRLTQERLLELFAAALAPGGFLVLGRVETLIGPARSHFFPVDPRERIFRRL